MQRPEPLPIPPPSLLASPVLAIVALVSLLVGCGEAPEPSAPEPPPVFEPLPADDGQHTVVPSGRLGRPDVVVILLDAARADAFGAYGDPVPTPAVDALAAEGTRFGEALSPAPWTGASVPALLTGLHPDALGAEHWESRLPGSVRTLAERLAESGYATSVFSQHPIYGSNRPLLRGFETFVEAVGEPLDTLPTAAEMLDLEFEGPSFALVHLLPPHTPYEPPPPFLESLTGEPSEGIEAWLDGRPVDAPLLAEFPHRRKPDSLSPEALRFIRDRYRETVRWADSLVGRLVEELQAAERFDDALVIVLSDHGEAFLEHDYFMHTRQVYRESLHIPLVVKWPQGLEGFESVVGETVGLVDLVPTLIDGLGLATGGGERFQGTSWLPRVFDRAPLRRSLVASTRGQARQHREPRASAMVELDGWTLVHEPGRGPSELYRLSDDPTQQHDLASSEPERRRFLERLLRDRRRAHAEVRRQLGGGGDATPLDAETEAELEALGYL